MRPKTSHLVAVMIDQGLAAATGSRLTHRVSPFPVLVRVVTLQHALGDMPALFHHELVKRIGKVARRDPPHHHAVVRL